MDKFQWNAEDYARFSSAQLEWARESISKVNLQKNENILDVGCGDGKVTVEIANYVSEGIAFGIDNSEEMISLAKARFPNSKYPNLFFNLIDARELKFNNKFDVVISNAALHWVDNHLKILHGMYKALKNGGRIYLQMGGKGNLPEAFFVVDKLISKPKWKIYFNDFKFPYYFLSVDEYKDLMLQTEFSNYNIQLVNKDMQHNGNESLKGWINTTWLPYIYKIPFEKREEFIEEILVEFNDSFPPDKNDIYHLNARRLIVEAKKNN